MFDEYVLSGMSVGPPRSDALRAVRVQLRLPWYRALPLSCIERLDLEIDGVEQNRDHLRMVINGDGRALADVAQMHESWWFVLDTVDLEIDPAERVAPGVHRVSIALQLRIPYGDPDFRPQMRFTQLALCTKELTLLGSEE